MHKDNSRTGSDPPKGNRKGTQLFPLIGGVLSTLRRSPSVVRSRGTRIFSHPNALPVIDVSEILFPFCIMSPWMPDGNITQYVQVNPGTNRLVLVRAR